MKLFVLVLILVLVSAVGRAFWHGKPTGGGGGASGDLLVDASNGDLLINPANGNLLVRP